MRFFEKQVDRRSRNAMIEFLTRHYRYSTGYSVSSNASYANRVKVHALGLTNDQTQKAYDLLSSDEDIWGDLRSPIAEFTARHSGYYTMGANGRQGGYLVLYNSRYEDTGYKSRCRNCGQLNYKRVADLPVDPVERVIAQEILQSHASWVDAVYLMQSAISELPGTDDDKLALIRRLKPLYQDCTESNLCGLCGAEGDRGRVNLGSVHRRLSVTAEGIDNDPGFEEWSLSRLRDRVELICDFDRTCDQIRDQFIDMCDSCSVVEEEILVPKTVRRIVCAEHAG